MAKTPVGSEIKSIKVFDAKFETGAKAAVAKGIDKAFKADPKHQAGQPANGGHFISLNVTVVLDKVARTIQGSCKWEVSVMENGQRKMYPAVKQVKAATATVPDVNPAKIAQADVDEAAMDAAEAEIAGILKKLP